MKPPATAATLASLQSQIDSGDRMKAKSADVAQRLRLLEVRLSELAARASEVAVGTRDQVAYGNDVEDATVTLQLPAATISPGAGVPGGLAAPADAAAATEAEGGAVVDTVPVGADGRFSFEIR